MSEIVSVQYLDDSGIIFPMERELFYKEQIEIYKNTGKPTKSVEVVNIFLFNEDGQIIIQKRSSNKKHNADLMDKSVGGHIVYGDTPNFTVMLETVQELQVPSIVLNNNDDFTKTYKLIKNYTSTTAIVKHLITETVLFPKIINEETITIANKTYIYLGIYEGSVKNIDREAKGILFYSLSELEYEIDKFPNNFTYDLQYFFKKYRSYFEDFVKEIKKN